MASFVEIAGKTIRLILLYLKNFSLNSYRRLIIAFQRVGIFWQKRRMAKQFKRLGESIYVKFAAGDVNPLLQDEVKDRMSSLDSLQANIVRRKGAIQEIREQIKTTSYRLTPSPVASGSETTLDEPVDK